MTATIDDISHKESPQVWVFDHPELIPSQLANSHVALIRCDSINPDIVVLFELCVTVQQADGVSEEVSYMDTHALLIIIAKMES